VPPERLLEYEAVRLFHERAEAVLPTFRLTGENAPAAGDMFRLLTRGSRTAQPRQQTLRATMDWSYALLSEPERDLLCRLSVFAGGWTLEAAEAVCGRDGEVLDRLTDLVEKSLVQYQEQEGAERYRLLEPVRQYGQERLRASGQSEAARQRHCDFFLRLAESAEPELHGAEQSKWLDRLEAEHDNLRAALGWCLAEGDNPEAALRLAGALTWFWAKRGHLAEGSEWTDGRCSAAPPLLPSGPRR
jgi:non-specific serine/threonine protein kinase